MVFDAIENFGKYISLNSNFPVVEKFLEENDLSELEPGKHRISENVFVISETVTARTKSDAVLEAHKNFIDVQLCLNSVDSMGWTALEDCDDIKTPYDSDMDLIFYNNEIQKQIAVSKENFVIFFPWDAHAPNIGEGEFHKIIFKVRV